MGRRALVGAVCAGLLAACSGGGGSAATTTTSSSATSTTKATTSTTTPEQAVKAAYLAYWSTADRVLAAPDPNDAELLQRAVDPLLSSLKDQLATNAAQSHRTTVPPGHQSTHRIDTVDVTDGSASLTECFVDGRVELGPNGEVVDDATVSKVGQAILTLAAGNWKVSDIRFVSRSEGVSGCAV